MLDDKTTLSPYDALCVEIKIFEDCLHTLRLEVLSIERRLTKIKSLSEQFPQHHLKTEPTPHINQKKYGLHNNDPAYVQALEICGHKELGLPPLLAMPKRNFYLYVKRGIIPAPVKKVGQVSLWLRSDILGCRADLIRRGVIEGDDVFCPYCSAVQQQTNQPTN
jgi:hypothetical protein